MIKVTNVHFTYPGNREPTLKELNFEVAPGEIFGFLGPSGAGKSTAQKLLYKILGDYSGKVQVMGKDLQDWDQTYFEKIGVGFELPNHYLKLTGKENLALFASFYSQKPAQKISSLFAMVGLEEAMNVPVERYSKGMKMRLNFIRALQHNPQLLFFDEPTAGLDPVNAHTIKQHILDLKKAGKTIFITTHNMETADQLCDRVAFMVNGRLVLIEAPAQLKQQYGKKVVQVWLENGAYQEFALEKLGQNDAFTQFLNQAPVARMHSMEASLEAVFIEVTGQSLKA